MPTRLIFGKEKYGTWWLLHPNNYVKKFKSPMPLPTDHFVLAKIKHMENKMSRDLARKSIVVAEKITGRKWCGHCQAYKSLENGVKRVVKGKTYWKCSSCSGKT